MNNGKERTRQEWRALGFYYERDDRSRKWRVVASAAGGARLCALLREYGRDPRNAALGEHAHYGPYMYFEIMTATEPQIGGHAIAGRPEDLSRLADLIEAGMAKAAPGTRFSIGKEFAQNPEYTLEIEVGADGFDPAGADPYI